MAPCRHPGASHGSNEAATANRGVYAQLPSNDPDDTPEHMDRQAAEAAMKKAKEEVLLDSNKPAGPHMTETWR